MSREMPGTNAVDFDRTLAHCDDIAGRVTGQRRAHTHLLSVLQNTSRRLTSGFWNERRILQRDRQVRSTVAAQPYRGRAYRAGRC